MEKKQKIVTHVKTGQTTIDRFMPVCPGVCIPCSVSLEHETTFVDGYIDFDSVAIKPGAFQQNFPQHPVSLLWGCYKYLCCNESRGDLSEHQKDILLHIRTAMGAINRLIRTKEGDLRESRRLRKPVLDLKEFLDYTQYVCRDYERLGLADMPAGRRLVDSLEHAGVEGGIKAYMEAWAQWAGDRQNGDSVSSGVVHLVMTDDSAKDKLKAFAEGFGLLPKAEPVAEHNEVIVLPPAPMEDAFSRKDDFPMQTNAIVEFTLSFNADPLKVGNAWMLIADKATSVLTHIDRVERNDNNLVVYYNGSTGEALQQAQAEARRVQLAVLDILQFSEGLF